MPRLSRKKEKSKIIKKKNTKKRTKKITTKKNLKGGAGREIDTVIRHPINRLGFSSTKNFNTRKQINNIHNHSSVNANRRAIDNLIKDYSNEIIQLINFGCLPHYSKKKMNNDPWQTCNSDAVKKIKETFEPIIKKLKKEIEDENTKKLVFNKTKQLNGSSTTDNNLANLDMGMFNNSGHAKRLNNTDFEGFGNNNNN
jgi:hypothetical protein